MKALNPKLDWALRGAIALVVLSIGIIPKVTGEPTMLANFERWGYPEWSIGVIATFETLGIALLLIPKTVRIGAAVVVATMLGALMTHLRADEYVYAPIPVVVGSLAGALGPERFLREIAIAARLQHPHVLALIDSGEADGVLYYVMPYVEGETLARRIERLRQLPIEEALRLAGEIASGLQYAHAQGVVHRDLKPANVMFTGGHAVIMDFGIGLALGDAGTDRLTHTGLALGTPAYMSPEQASGQAGPQADVYALGCVLFEMLTGSPPFTGPTGQSILIRHAVEPVPSIAAVRPGVPGALQRTVDRALAKSPEDRFADMEQLRTELDRITHEACPALPAAETGNEDPTIAVLPFTNLSADPEQDYFCQGVAEEITNALVRGGLRVTARAAARAGPRTDEGVSEIGRRLGGSASRSYSTEAFGRRRTGSDSRPS